jgi:hypothetical protein
VSAVAPTAAAFLFAVAHSSNEKQCKENLLCKLYKLSLPQQVHQELAVLDAISFKHNGVEAV